MAAIFWNDKIAVDGGIIDADHKHLIDISNRFISSKGSQGLALLSSILDDLEHYACTHFWREQRLQFLVQYPAGTLHKESHAALLRSLTGIAERLLAATEATLDGVKDEINQLLRSWLIDHILKEDVKMRPYGAAIQKHAARMASLGAVSSEPKVWTITYQWQKELEVDGDVIDADHRHLFDIVNTFIVAANEGAERAILNETLTQLQHYTRTHFEREERLQLAVGFPFLDAHKKEHRALIASLQQMATTLASTTDSAQARLDLSDLLRSWLIVHIRQEDFRMAPYVKQMRGLGAKSVF